MRNGRTQWVISFNLMLLLVAVAAVLLQAGVVQMQQREPSLLGNYGAYQQDSTEPATQSVASTAHGSTQSENEAQASGHSVAQPENGAPAPGNGDTQAGHEALTPSLGDTRDTLEIVCWGDSLTSGMGASKAVIVNGFESYDASGKSYPEILEHFTGITTYSFGVPGARSDEIAYMQGAIDELPKPEPQPGSSDEAAMASGDAVADEAAEPNDEAPQTPDAEQPADEAQAFDASSVESPRSAIDEQVIEEGKKHPGDVLLLEIGSNGGWNSDYTQLIDQYRKMIEHSGCKNYLIIGDTDDPGTSLGDLNQKPFESGTDPGETKWEQALSKEFGNRFINMRTYLIRNGLADAGLIPTEDDKKLADTGCISPQLRADWTHLNSFGYYAKAKAVYLRGSELGYWNPSNQAL